MDVRSEHHTVTVSVSIPVAGINVNRLEKMSVVAGREIFQKAVRLMQERFQEAFRDRLERREWRHQWLQTRLGPVQVAILKVRNRTTGRHVMLGRDLLELAPRARITNSVARRAVELRVRGQSYRSAAKILAAMTGARMSAMAVWRLVQAKGRAQCAAEYHAMQATLSGKIPRGKAPEHLYLEADAIHLRAQRSASRDHRVKVGLSYTGRERVSGYRKSRHRLSDKRLYGGVEQMETFGWRWYAILERHHSVSEAKAILYLTDGDPGLRNLKEMHFPQAIRQHDWAHVFRDVQSAAPDETRRARWVNQLCEGRDNLMRRNMERHRRSRGARPEAIERVVGALDKGDFYGWKEYRRRYDPEHTQRLPRGTGAIEKNQEITIGRAMKRRGMAWTASGANHLAKLIFAWQDKNTWELLWQEPFPP